MVVKRFFRNRLAMVGLIIIAFMFLFSFLGGVLSPYGQAQVFRKTEVQAKDYAGAAVNKDMNVMIKDGYDYVLSDINMAILDYQITNELPEIGDKLLFIESGDNGLYHVSETTKVATIKNGALSLTDGVKAKDKVSEAYKKALKKDEKVFDVNAVKYGYTEDSLYKLDEVAIASYLIYNAYNESDVIDYSFRNVAEKVIATGATSFASNGNNYEVEYKDNNEIVVFYKVDGSTKTEYAMASKYTISSITKEFLSMEFKYDVIEAINSGVKEFKSVDAKGAETTFKLQSKNGQHVIKRDKITEVNDTNAAPSKEHWLGTDASGMDLLTRLMYGGRISLVIGFVVVALEMIIGVILGGLAGFFGKWVDILIMRIVELFNCIPTMPLFIIIGSILDARKVESFERMVALAILLALFYWTGIARMVRGQILSLREQEFMIATEAMGIRTHKRIFKHLVPNVLPQLIVIATMDLGGIILTEASLSFLGLGMKFPHASWGAIINAVNDLEVMKNYWWIWIPAGICILITVLGFNFVGDGLRDAFDPKMKR
jgi:peptide/nickel transport system permease protein